MKIEFNRVTWYSKLGAIILFLIVVPILVFYINGQYTMLQALQSASPVLPPTQTTTTSTVIATASYACSAGKTITAMYYSGQATPAASPNQPPTPGGSVALTLSDGRAMTLEQTISADGARYANVDGSIVFWNKGNGLMFTENGQQTFMGCIEAAKDPGGLPLVYENAAKGFSLRYPTGYTVDESYTYQELGPGKDISGVKFTIPASVATGTNLSADSYISVEQIPQTQSCTANMFIDLPPAPGAAVSTVTDNGTTYSMASYTGAAAGNRYDETVYAIPGTNPCIAVRYFIHYGVIDNYPPGMVKQFDQQTLTDMFDAIRRTLVVSPQ